MERVQVRDYVFEKGICYADIKAKELKRTYKTLGYNRLPPARPLLGLFYSAVTVALINVSLLALRGLWELIVWSNLFRQDAGALFTLMFVLVVLFFLSYPGLLQGSRLLPTRCDGCFELRS